MKETFLTFAAVSGLLGTLVAAALVFAGQVSLGVAKTSMLVATVVWFVAAPLWLLRGDKGQAN